MTVATQDLGLATQDLGPATTLGLGLATTLGLETLGLGLATTWAEMLLQVTVLPCCLFRTIPLFLQRSTAAVAEFTCLTCRC